MNYKKLNQYLGWLVFFIATAVYFITLEDTVSLWDCGEYITTAYKLEVGHPPGAPLFMMIGRMFSFFAAPENVAVWVNRLSALSSSFSILFMFWSITLLAKKMVLKNKAEMSKGDMIAVLGSGLVGSLAYTFSDSFWFSAVEGEVYAMASLFTAIIMWAILKWDEEMALVQNNQLISDVSPDRWLLLIMFLLGLAIGVHLLGILVVPAIGFVLYFRHKQKADLKGILLTGIVSVAVLGFIQEGVIPGSISLASEFEVMFTNSLGLPFLSGTIFFFGALITACVLLIRRARKKNQPLLYNITMGLVMLLIGYGSFAMIVIRSSANTPLDENDPENLVTLKSYLKREQYGSAPIFSGPYWNSTENPTEEFGDRPPFYLRRFIVSKGEEVVKAFKSEKDAQKYVAANGGSIEEKYFMSNEDHRENQVATYSQTTFFPRMYYSDEPGKIPGYKMWSGYDPADGADTEKGKDGLRLPTFGENITYFARYQVNWMYWRYFMWNFAGRQNDIQGHGDQMRGNWKSGFSVVDNMRLGNQDDAAPYFTSENKGNNKFFFLPLVLGLIGLFIHIYKSPKDAFVVFLAFLFTGIAIVVYLNQKTNEPRERDYAFAGSFYFFAFWVGLGVYGLYEAFKNFTKKDYVQLLTAVGMIGGVTLLIDAMSSEVSLPITLSWVIISIIGLALMLLMTGMKKVIKSDGQGAIVAIVLGLFIPIIMGMQGWDDHDRSNKTSAHDLAKDYLMSCGKNGILFTGGDNDTFPLWYMQEVEGYRTDVRVCNLSLMQTDWYTDQMKMKAYDSDALPIKFTEDQILMYAGYTDQTLFAGLFELFYLNAGDRIINDVIKIRVKNNRSEAQKSLDNFNIQVAPLLASVTSDQANVIARLDVIKSAITTNTKTTLEENIYSKYVSVMELLSGAQNGLIKIDEQSAQKLQSLIMEMDKPWDFANIDDMMKFTRDDKNIIMYSQNQKVRIFPSAGVILPVDANNAVKSGVIDAKDKGDCAKELRFNFDGRGLTREQMMMIEVLANNDWKRGIYFSSPGGNDVALALYRRGYLKQNGMVYELSPLNNFEERCNVDKMYANLMKNYDFGDLKNPNVLTDYYARRQTTQFRTHFSVLAQELLRKADEAKDIKSKGLEFIKMYAQAGRKAEADRYMKIFKNADKIIAENKRKAINLVKHSIEIMPLETVIDYGEPRKSGKTYDIGSTKVEAFGDGTVQEYVAILFTAGDKKTANELGLKLAKQLESIIKYYEVSDIAFAANPQNTEDLFAALDNYFTVMMIAMDPKDGDAKGKLAVSMNAKVRNLYDVVFPKMYAELKAKASDNGESITRGSTAGKYANMLFQLQDHLEAMGIHYGMISGPSAPQPAPASAVPSEMDINSLMNQQVKGDSVLE
jgi:hypothetical protein